MKWYHVFISQQQDVFFPCRLHCKESSVTLSCSKHAFSCFSSCGLKDLTPSPLVCGPLLKWKPVANCVTCSEPQWGHAPYGEVLLHGRWSGHQSPLFLLCSGFKQNTGQSGKPHSQMLQFANGFWEAGIHLCVVKTLSGILQKHVHVNKQAVGNVP